MKAGADNTVTSNSATRIKIMRGWFAIMEEHEERKRQKHRYETAEHLRKAIVTGQQITEGIEEYC